MVTVCGVIGLCDNIALPPYANSCRLCKSATFYPLAFDDAQFGPVILSGRMGLHVTLPSVLAWKFYRSRLRSTGRLSIIVSMEK